MVVEKSTKNVFEQKKEDNIARMEEDQTSNRDYINVIKNKKTIVILGAGYAGLFLSLNLEHYLNNQHKEYEIILVDKNPYHQLLQEIHFVAAGLRSPKEVQISIPVMISNKKMIKFVQAIVKEIELDQQNVIIETSRDKEDRKEEKNNNHIRKTISIEYDYLVVALGAKTRYFDIPGAEEFSLPLRSIYDAARIYSKVQEIATDAIEVATNNSSTIGSSSFSPKTTPGHSTSLYKKIIIVGGGATGISLAGALADYLNKIEQERRGQQYSSVLRDRISIEVIEATPSILPGWDKKVAAECMKTLWNKSIKVFVSSPVSKVEEHKLYLQDGTVIPSTITIWTAGVRGYDLKTKPDIEKLRDGRIVVNEFCQNERYYNVFAIGDIAAIKNPAGKIYPPLAQVAVRQAKYLAELLSKLLSKEDSITTANSSLSHAALQEEKKFDYNIKAQIISLGINDYVGSFGDRVISGDMAKIVEEFSKDAYIKALKSGGADVATNIYGDNTISQVLAGITFAGFTFNRILRKLS
jgi:NADH dehydrogenase